MTIHTLDLDFRGLEHSIAVFVVEGPQGLTLVETGPYSTYPRLIQVLEQRGYRLEDFKHVFLSHIHFDHAGAAWAFAQSGATVYVHPKGLPHLADPEKLYNSARLIYKEKMDELWGEMRSIDLARLHAPEHGAVIEAAGLRFTAWYTPGHAVHHIAWMAETPGAQDAVVFTGDVAGVKIENGPVVPPCPPPDINVEDWQASINLLRELPSDRLYLTHYGLVEQKQAHLDALEERLLSWAAWMRPYAEAQTPAEEVVPLFQEYVLAQLKAAGVAGDTLARYEAANPAFMSVAGLMRYWKKKLA